jgi:quaternary ammonium compound-resistance protein SugE
MTFAPAWLYLVVSGIIDVAWALSMKKTHGFDNPLWSVVLLALLGAFAYLLMEALHDLPVDTAYAVWAGMVQPERCGHRVLRRIAGLKLSSG